MPFIYLHSAQIDCELTPVGAALVSLHYHMEDGAARQVVLSPLSHAEGVPEPARAGCTVGPCCGRVRGAEMTLHGKKYQLDANENGNHLHGGFLGAAGRPWRVVEASRTHAVFALELPDGEGGYPGYRRVEAEYRLEDNALTVRYRAETDASSWLCLTNHAYWDLTGRFDGSAMAQTLQVPADRAVFNDAQHLPVSIQPVDGTPFDFREPISPADMLARYPGHPQCEIARGFNNALMLDADAPFAARLVAPDASLGMTMTTDYPALVFYSGGFLGGNMTLTSGPAVPGAALALEAQSLPDPFHLPGVEPEPFEPGVAWEHFIRWELE